MSDQCCCGSDPGTMPPELKQKFDELDLYIAELRPDDNPPASNCRLRKSTASSAFTATLQTSPSDAIRSMSAQEPPVLSKAPPKSLMNSSAALISKKGRPPGTENSFSAHCAA